MQADDGRGEQAVTEIRAADGQADFVAADLGSTQSAVALAEEALAIAGSIDVLVNKAGPRERRTPKTGNPGEKSEAGTMANISTQIDQSVARGLRHEPHDGADDNSAWVTNRFTRIFAQQAKYRSLREGSSKMTESETKMDIGLGFSAPAGEEVVVTTAAEIPVTAVAEFRAPIEAVFDYVVAEDTPTRMMLGYGPVPGVAGGEIHEGPWDHPGAYRTVHLAGGGTSREEITALRRPRYFSYRVSDFSISARHVVAAARGEWWFETRGDSTLVRWRYTFEPRSLLRAPLAFAFARLLWTGYMGRAMREAKAQAEDVA